MAMDQPFAGGDFAQAFQLKITARLDLRLPGSIILPLLVVFLAQNERPSNGFLDAHARTRTPRKQRFANRRSGSKATCRIFANRVLP